jgi:hypothetical protein
LLHGFLSHTATLALSGTFERNARSFAGEMRNSPSIDVLPILRSLQMVMIGMDRIKDVFRCDDP